MADVKLDIAGFYFRSVPIEVPDGASVEELMIKVKAMQKAASTTGARLDFDTEEATINDEPKVFLDSITITHEAASAVSGQKYNDPALNGNRKYPDGIYASADEAGRFATGEDNKTPFVAIDRNKTGLLTWQYYVYDENGVDVSRASENGPRRVVPFRNKIERVHGDDGKIVTGLKDNDTVVWRLVMIRTRPDGGLGPKTQTISGQSVQTISV